ncbi:anti-sigma factor [Adhaeribacter sp. BT258]|uniref:Anti-sigma factor n=1 Tax=Adhaeribacter terrigena TaxID=2793070 RepID=A0ABS1C181_9BACT|nr:anti-sigma factor [Adhaeribacter terrigena]MBK0402936.1 anti-sigma factor [Adhaeribacter terrigena]
MEQHNIDSRFKEGLQNLNRQPSADAWARLQSQLNTPIAAPETELVQPEEKKEERRILMWWHYAAAAVVLLFISVGIFKNGSYFGGKTEMPLAVNKTTEIAAPTVKTPEVSAPVSEKISAPETMIAAIKTPETVIESKNEISSRNAVKNGIKTEVKTTVANAPKTQIAQVTKKVKTEKSIHNTPIQEQPNSEQLVQKTEENLIASTQSNKAEHAKTSETKPALLAGMAIEVIVKKDNSENALAMAETTAEEDKNSKLKSIFKQAKNLKNGERVDLQAIGLNSDSKLAMGTRNIQEKFSKVLDI